MNPEAIRHEPATAESMVTRGLRHASSAENTGLVEEYVRIEQTIDPEALETGTSRLNPGAAAHAFDAQEAAR